MNPWLLVASLLSSLTIAAASAGAARSWPYPRCVGLRGLAGAAPIWHNRFGVLARDFAPKPAYFALSRLFEQLSAR